MQNARASIKFIEKCYKLYEQKMYHVALSILHDSGLAEDAVQEAFMKLMKSDTYFKDITSDDCKRYIIMVIKHSAINIYNKKKREAEVIYLSDKDSDFDNSELKLDSITDYKREELLGMIEKLPDKYQQVTKCIAIEELSVRETSIKLGISEANVRKRYERAKVLLRNMLKNEDSFQYNAQSV